MEYGLEIYLYGTRLRFTFGFFAVWALLFAQSAFSKTAQTALLCCILHEMGHCWAMGISGIKVKELTFYSGGIRLKSCPAIELSGTFTEIFVLASGCLVNLFLFFMGKITGNGLFADINLALMLFNMLPFSVLDGGRIMGALLSEICPYEDISAAFKVIDLLMGAAAVLFLIRHGNISFTLPLTMGMIIAEGIFENK